MGPRDSLSSSTLPSVNPTYMPSRISHPDINRADEIFTRTTREAVGKYHWVKLLESVTDHGRKRDDSQSEKVVCVKFVNAVKQSRKK
ncbi:hypothetical protein E2C01_014650 [Portunus trituberculatus]|uniref:Uncharacterized protein n=1 Tax=Portunus trituberculatus TaxID=210409 RepID=A0A5B7DJS7_PORTR|nr:hypothetical protein [Portunus trituberculatus]